MNISLKFYKLPFLILIIFSYLSCDVDEDSVIIADEMQNATPNQMKMLLTRIGDDSRMAITGDIAQTDRKEHENGLMDFQKLYARYSESKYISVCAFDHFDIERHPAVAEVLDIYGDK